MGHRPSSGRVARGNSPIRAKRGDFLLPLFFQNVVWCGVTATGRALAEPPIAPVALLGPTQGPFFATGTLVWGNRHRPCPSWGATSGCAPELGLSDFGLREWVATFLCCKNTRNLLFSLRDCASVDLIYLSLSQLIKVS